MDKIYSFKASSKICLKDVLSAVKELRDAHRYKLISYLCEDKNLESYGGKWVHSISHYLRILENANIIHKEKKKFGKKKSFGSIVREVYFYNPNVGKWRIPNRETGLSKNNDLI